MTLDKWETLDKQFQDMLLSAYHHYIHSLKCEGDEHLKDAHLFHLDKTMKEAYTLRQSYINTTLEF